MKIELSDRQAQEVMQGRPVEVIDPESDRAFVVVTRELYERVRPLLEGGPERAPPSPSPAVPSPGEGQPPRVRLRDLPAPPEVVEEAARWCKKYGWQGKKNRQEVEEQLKLQYHYGGQAVYILRTPEGAVVIPIGEQYKDTPDLRYVLLTPEERLHASLEVPPCWRDTTSEILT
jgi:hypothetical protein